MRTITTTREQLIEAYKQWELDVRMGRTPFLKEEEVRARDLTEHAEACTDCLLGYLGKK